MARALKILAFVLVATSSCLATEPLSVDDSISARFRTGEIVLGMRLMDLRERFSAGYLGIVFGDCVFTTNGSFRYYSCKSEEAVFRFDKYDRLTRFTFSRKQAEKIFNKRFQSLDEYLVFLKHQYRIKRFEVETHNHKYDPTFKKMTEMNYYSYQAQNNILIEVRSDFRTLIGRRGFDTKINFD